MSTHHGNLHQFSVTMSRVTYFILRAHAGTGVSHSQHRKKLWRSFGKNAGEWTGRMPLQLPTAGLLLDYCTSRRVSEWVSE